MLERARNKWMNEWDKKSEEHEHMTTENAGRILNNLEQ